jgi:hypothetical protein
MTMKCRSKRIAQTMVLTPYDMVWYSPESKAKRIYGLQVNVAGHITACLTVNSKKRGRMEL